MRTIIAICGKQLRGKTSVASMLQEMLNQNDGSPGFIINPLALPVKQETAALLGISLAELEGRKAKDPKVREMLQAVGEGRRQEDPEYWIAKNTAYPGSYIVDDLRYDNEIDGLIQAADVFYLIKVECPREIVIEQGRGIPVGEDHISEVQLELLQDYDLRIHNDQGYEEMRRQAAWAAHAVVQTMMFKCLSLQSNILDPFLGSVTEDINV